MSSKRRYFGTDGIRGTVGVLPMTQQFLSTMGQALGHWLRLEGHSLVLLGRDTRESGVVLEQALISGLVQQGIDVIDVGVVTTPMVAYLTLCWKAHLGIVVSASHNPYTDNGLKFFSREGMKLPDAFESAMESLLDNLSSLESIPERGQIRVVDEANAVYLDFCHALFPQLSLKGLKIVLDGAQGAGSQIGPMILKSFGAEVVALYCEPNGVNINEGCGATSPKRLAEAVLAEKADLGIALDGDADRLIMVDETGEIVDGDELLWVLASEYQRMGRLSGGVVGTLMTNMGLVKALERLHIPFERVPVGDRFVMEALLAKGWILGGEASGHLLCLDKASTGDAMVAALNIMELLIQAKKTLYTLKRGMLKWPQVMKNVALDRAEWERRAPNLQKSMGILEQELPGQLRMVVRPSGTEPVVRVMVEAESLDLATQCVDGLVEELTGVK